jgi:hypothetical protein
MPWYKSKQGWAITVIAVLTFIANNVLKPWELGSATVSIYETICNNFHYL